MKEPDGFIGWPKPEGASTSAVPGFTTDNMLGEAMGLRPLVRMAHIVRETPALQARYGQKAGAYLKLAETVFEKWDKRGCWREVKDGGVWVVPPFGVDLRSGRFTNGYEKRFTDGFTNPDNRQNLTALWLIALHAATGKPVYRERAEKWWRVMKSRMRLRDGGQYYEWKRRGHPRSVTRQTGISCRDPARIADRNSDFRLMSRRRKRRIGARLFSTGRDAPQSLA